MEQSKNEMLIITFASSDQVEPIKSLVDDLLSVEYNVTLVTLAGEANAMRLPSFPRLRTVYIPIELLNGDAAENDQTHFVTTILDNLESRPAAALLDRPARSFCQSALRALRIPQIVFALTPDCRRALFPSGRKDRDRQDIDARSTPQRTACRGLEGKW